MGHRACRRSLNGQPRFRALAFATTFLAALITVGAASAAQSLSDDDVSWLFPAPHSTADLANLIAIKDLGGASSVWTSGAFQSFVSIAEGPASKISENGSQIGLPSDAHKIDAWFVAGVRFDSGALGLSPAIAAQFGQLPQIRLILQPVTVTGTSVKVNDYAAHLIFDFVKGFDPPANQIVCRDFNRIPGRSRASSLTSPI